MCKAKCFIAGATFLALILILLSIGLACGAKPAQEPASPPVTEPATPPSTTPQLPEETPVPPPPVSTGPEIPANYTTYTDELNLFSISYPADWETALSLIADSDKNIKEYISNLKSGLPVEKTSTIFLAGRPTAAGYYPMISITIEPVPDGVSTHDQMVESNIRGARKVFPDYQEFSRVKTTVDGREATILDYEGTFPGLEKQRSLQMLTLVDKTTWVVGGGANIEDFAQWENDFNTIVRSLRISK